VTGHTGFKGAWLAFVLTALGANVTGIGLNPENTDGAFSVLRLGEDLIDLRMDLAAPTTSGLLAQCPEVVFHLAAQPLVRRGLRRPAETYRTNVVGTARLLEGLEQIGTPACIVVATTDKVYRNDGSGGPFAESDELGGNDPYSASKACVELMLEQWRKSSPSSTKIGSVRCGNVLGGGDRGEERLIPDLLRAHSMGTSTAIRAPLASRPWIHVLDAVAGYLRFAEVLSSTQLGIPSINLGPSPGQGTITVGEVADFACRELGSLPWTDASTASPSENVPLALDVSLAEKVLGWRAKLDLSSSLDWTFAWERSALDEKDMRDVSLDQLRAHWNLS